MPFRVTSLGLAGACAFGIAVTCLGAAHAQPTEADSSSAQPELPKPIQGIGQGTPGTGSGGTKNKPLTVRKVANRHVHHKARRTVSAWHEPVVRPALAGVELLENLPHPLQPEHVVVPLPAYPLENFAAFYITPPPPVICHAAARDPYAPDPHLLYEKPVICAADNP